MKKVQVHAHRGGAALYPENTLPAFLNALTLKIDALEMDVVISKDERAVVSHEPFFRYDLCINDRFEESQNSLFRLNYSEIKQIDCGSKSSQKFPNRKNVKAVKPLLTDVIREVLRACRETERSIPTFTVELKSRKDLIGIFQPELNRFAALVMEDLKLLPRDKVILQSFDADMMNHLHQAFPEYKLCFLSDDGISPEETLKKIKFKPDFIGLRHQLLSKSYASYCQSRAIQILVWTPNTSNDWSRLIDLGVDGIITDAPNSLIDWLDEKNLLAPER